MVPQSRPVIEVFVKILEVCPNQLWDWTYAVGWDRVGVPGETWGCHSREALSVGANLCRRRE